MLDLANRLLGWAEKEGGLPEEQGGIQDRAGSGGSLICAQLSDEEDKKARKHIECGFH